MCVIIQSSLCVIVNELNMQMNFSDDNRLESIERAVFNMIDNLKCIHCCNQFHETIYSQSGAKAYHIISYNYNYITE